MDMGFIKVAALSPVVEVANPVKNVQNAVDEILVAAKENTQVIVLPELFLSGYTCGDLFFQSKLIAECKKSLLYMLEKTKETNSLIFVGMPLCVENCLYNVSAVMQKGNLLGFVPKTYLKNDSGFFEKRWFTSGKNLKTNSVLISDKIVPVGRLLFKMGDNAVIGAEICEDLFAPVSPSTIMAMKGANIIVNLSATQNIVSKYEQIKDFIKQHSAKDYCAYVFASGSVGESTTDCVFSNACIVAKNGKIINQSKTDEFRANKAVACIDIQNTNSQRLKNTSFKDNASDCDDVFGEYRIIECEMIPLDKKDIDIEVDAHPFVPKDLEKREKHCKEVLSVQSLGLEKRMKHTKMEKVIVGISGGLDSTLALLVIEKAMKNLSLPMENIICVTMPGFGTTGQTYKNSVDLVSNVGAQLREIDIRPACILHMEDIGHDINIHDTTYENTQARQRTQILMNLANKERALLVGTGDLSELALGWCTYNGDHMSMYGVNSGVPKTLIPHLIEYVAKEMNSNTAKILLDVINTPVSPELLPPNKNGEINQKTEEQIGPYELHDFFLYHFLQFGTEPEKISFLAQRAFKKSYKSEEIEKWLDLFLKRFFASQFKRSCLPDGVKVGSVSLSPRSDFKMPSDASFNIWQA